MTEVWRSTDGLPEGWARIVKRRVAGASAGTLDVYVLVPTGRLLRSRSEVQAYLDKEGITDVTVDQFDFSRKALPREVADFAGSGAPSSCSSAKSNSPVASGILKRKSKTLDGGPSEKRALAEIEADRASFAPSSWSGGMPKKPEKSPFQFLLEDYLDDDWKFMMTAFFLERHGCQEPPQLRETLGKFFDRFPSAEELHCSGWIAVDTLLKPRGYSETFARHLTSYTFDYVTNSLENSENRLRAHEISGTTDYAHRCFKIYVLKDFNDGGSLDYDTTVFLDWAKKWERV